jgi:VWFA-related protein
VKPRTLRFGFKGLILLLAATNGWRHSSAQTTPTPTFPSGTELITVDAVVVDNKGSPIVGLTKDDFFLQEDGQPQEIANFEGITLPGPGEGPGAAPAPAPPSPPRIATSALPTARGSAFLFVVDDIHLTGSEAAQARTTLERFLRVSVSQGDRITIVSTGTGAAWSGTLPEDREDLLAFVGRVQGRNTNPSTPLMTEYEALRIALYNDALSLRRAMGRYYNQGACAAPPYPCEQKVRADAQENQSRSQGLREASLAAIDRAIEGMARLHGRKAVLLLTEGFIHDDAPEDPYHRVVRAAQRANAAIYFIDVRGLEALPASASAEAARDVGLNPLAGATNQQEAIRKAMEAKDLVTHERFAPELTVGVETMADETGGLIVRNTNDLSGWLNRISTESRSYYLLGYHPNLAKAGGFRKIDLKVKRAGVHVRARKGYYSAGPEAKEAQASGSASGTVAGGFVPRDEVPLRLAIYTLEPGADKKTHVVAVTEINLVGLASAEREGPSVAQLDVRLEAIPRDGGKVQGRRLSIEAEPLPAGEKPATGFWRPLRLDLALPPGVYQVRATVTDSSNGRSGAASQRVVVPDPSAFHVSTPILSNAATTATEGGGQPVPAPVAHDHFSSAEGQQLFCAFQVLGAAKDASTGHYDVLSRFVLRNHEGQTLAAPDPRPIAVSASGQSQQVLVLPLAKLPAGAYELALTVEDRVAGKKEELVESFTAEDAPVAARATPPPSALTALAPVAPVPPELIPILERAGQYVVSYSRTFSHILADEEYRQQGHQENEGGPLIVRKMRSGVVFVTLPGPIPWVTFRDVFEVDGNKVRDRQERLAKLFQDSPATAREKAKAILEEAARFNLGPIRRTVNIPALALLFLHPDNQRRFTFEKKGRRSIGGIQALEIAFVERARPTLVDDGAGNGVPAKGSVWIDPARGTVLQTDVDYDLDPRDTYHRTRARVITTYRQEPKLDILVPDSMKEAYQWPVARQQAARVQRRGLNLKINEGEDQDDVVGMEAEARYSGYRRFEVTTEESFAPKPKEPD